MQIAGFVKNSFVDYPAHIAATVFVPGCNMDCWYCHNRPLWKSSLLIDQDEVEAFLEKRRGFLSGVVISGGEPTLQSDLSAFIRRMRAMGYLVKLDTNGLLPDTVEALLESVDYIALDLKAPPGELSRVVSFDCGVPKKRGVSGYELDDEPIWQTADLLMRSGIDYEFRTTFMPLLSEQDILLIAQRARGAKRYVLQQYRRPESIAIQPEPHIPETIKKAALAAKEFIEDVQIKGI